jgi:RimJ/RimL family protein N-acetyltransferase
MDLNLARQLAAEKSEFSSDHMVNFDSPEDFISRGIGFCIVSGDEIVSAATTFVVCGKGIEIQINTRKQHRRKSLATVVAAHLLLYCLENGLDPNWDAENERSAHLAEKLGYTPQGRYPVWIVARSNLTAFVLRILLKIESFSR